MQSNRDDILAQIIVNASVAMGYSAASEFAVSRIIHDLPVWSQQLANIPTEMLADCAAGALDILQPGKPLTPAHVRNQYQAFISMQRSVRVLPTSADYVSCRLCDGFGWQFVLVHCTARNDWFRQARGCRCNAAPMAYRREYALEPPGYENVNGIWQPAQGRLGLKCGCLFCQDRTVGRFGVAQMQEMGIPGSHIQAEQTKQKYEQAKANYGGDESDGINGYSGYSADNTEPADEYPF